MSTPFAFKTYLTKDQVTARANVIAAGMVQDTVPADDSKLVQYPNLIEKPYPIVLITNGVGTCGKDSFVKYMMSSSSRYNGIAKLSTIDPVRDAALILYKAMDAIRYLFSTPPRTAAEIVAEKGDKYRDFMYDIKCAWEKDQSATRYSVGTVLATVINDRGENLSVICIDSRETDTITRITDMILEAGIICLKVLITRPGVDTDTWQNGCDHNVCLDESFYDIVVRNDGTEENLKQKAWAFTRQLELLNQCYGVSALGSAGDQTSILSNMHKEEEKEDSAISPIGFPDNSGDTGCTETDGD